MVVSNLLFDAILFGALLLGIAVDAAVPMLHGTAFLAACGFATYVAAQEWSALLARRQWWTQESAATSVALSVGGFIYMWWHNLSDFSLLALSIGLMMASLMLAIATLGVLSAAFKQLSPAPVVGYLATLLGAALLGGLAGLCSLEHTPIGKAVVVIVALVVWKVRETLAPPTAQAQTTTAVGEAAPAFVPYRSKTTETVAAPVVPGAPKVLLVPLRGTLLDRFFPLLLVGGALMLATRQTGPLLHSVAPPASANDPALSVPPSSPPPVPR